MCGAWRQACALRHRRSPIPCTRWRGSLWRVPWYRMPVVGPNLLSYPPVRRSMKSVSFAIASLLFASSSLFAAHTLYVEDMHNFARIGGNRISPDGKWIAFTVTRSDLTHNRSVTNLWMMPAAGGAPRQLTFGEKGANADVR